MDEAMRLAMLQHADTAFPGGAASFSWGLEGLSTDRQVGSADAVRCLIGGQLTGRWASCDRGLLAAAHHAAGDLDAVIRIDRLANALALPRELREGSARAGGALLSMHDRLGTPGAGPYRALVRAGSGLGHLPVVQGLVWAGIGLDVAAAAAASLHGFCMSILGAAVRLSLIGYVVAQQILTGLRGLAAEILAQPAPDLDRIGTFTPMSEIAAMRHETQSARLFAN